LKRIGIVGCGSIGSEIAFAIDKKIINADVVALYDIDGDKAKKLLSKVRNQKPLIAKNLEELVKISDLVVETASPEAVKGIAKIALLYGRNIFVLSVSGLINNPWILDSFKKRKYRVYYPSGAIAGIDGIKAARMGKIKSVTLTTSKPCSTLKNVQYVKKSGKLKSGCKLPKIVFEGNAGKAIKCFPQNINLASTISLSGLGSEKTKVKIIAFPDGKNQRNIHEIKINGDFGEMYIRNEDVPSKNNPKTSYLAILSSIALLHEICNAK